MSAEIAVEQDIHGQLRISMLAERQHGVVSRAQLVELGLGRGAIEHRVAVGGLIPLRRGVYAVGHRALRPRAHLMAALLDVGPGAVLSHASAAALWGIRPSAAGRIDITVDDRRRGRAGVRLHHSLLPLHQVTVIDGIAVTTIERTILDLAAVVDADALRYAIEQAEHLELPDWRVLRALAGAAGGRRGIRALREILDDQAIGTQITKSRLERAFRAFVRRHPDLPQPERNVWVEGFEVDCVWRDARLVVELDSRLHLGFGKYARDRRKDRALVTRGWRVVRVTWEHIHDEPVALHRDLIGLLNSG
jgi:very-short-patch-repair endonuclease